MRPMHRPYKTNIVRNSSDKRNEILTAEARVNRTRVTDQTPQPPAPATPIARKTIAKTDERKAKARRNRRVRAARTAEPAAEVGTAILAQAVKSLIAVGVDAAIRTRHRLLSSPVTIGFLPTIPSRRHDPPRSQCQTGLTFSLLIPRAIMNKPCGTRNMPEWFSL